jgi:hypothetical protein
LNLWGGAANSGGVFGHLLDAGVVYLRMPWVAWSFSLGPPGPPKLGGVGGISDLYISKSPRVLLPRYGARWGFRGPGSWDRMVSSEVWRR